LAGGCSPVWADVYQNRGRQVNEKITRLPDFERNQKIIFSVSRNSTAARYPPSSVIDDDPDEIEEFPRKFKGNGAARAGQARKVVKV
jgi:hypothetical protein